MKLKLKVFTLLSLVFGLSPFSVYGCLNPIGQPFVGQKIEIEGVSAPDFIKNLTTHKSREYWEGIRRENIVQQEKRPLSNLYSNNLAVALVHLGQIQEAIKILEDLEKKSPRLYATATNLGTAYELNGENEKALEWIKEAINRNKEAHLGTEWLHVKILEAKISMGKDMDWLKTHSVLGVDFNTNQDSQQQNLPIDHLGQQKTLKEVEDALIYQLHERTEFVKPPEPIVAYLLADLSKVFALRRSPEYVESVENLSIQYGSAPNKTDNNSVVSENKSETKNYLFYGIIIGAIALFTLLFVYFYINRKKSFITQ